jgi:hypothetical protein
MPREYFGCWNRTFDDLSNAETASEQTCDSVTGWPSLTCGLFSSSGSFGMLVAMHRELIQGRWRLSVGSVTAATSMSVSSTSTSMKERRRSSAMCDRVAMVAVLPPKIRPTKGKRNETAADVRIVNCAFGQVESFRRLGRAIVNSAPGSSANGYRPRRAVWLDHGRASSDPPKTATETTS